MWNKIDPKLFQKTSVNSFDDVSYDNVDIDDFCNKLSALVEQSKDMDVLSEDFYKTASYVLNNGYAFINLLMENDPEMETHVDEIGIVDSICDGMLMTITTKCNGGTDARIDVKKEDYNKPFKMDTFGLYQVNFDAAMTCIVGLVKQGRIKKGELVRLDNTGDTEIVNITMFGKVLDQAEVGDVAAIFVSGDHVNDYSPNIEVAILNECSETQTPLALNTQRLDITKCNTSEEVNEVLTLMATKANTSIAYALNAQIQIVKYVAKPDLYGSTFDLFFKNLGKAVKQAADEYNAYEIKEQAALMLNNFIFFIKAKIEWELDANRRESEQLFVEASHGLAESVLSLASIYYGGAAKVDVTVAAIQKLSKVFFDPEQGIDNIFMKAGRWFFKSIRTSEKMGQFHETLDRLADKLVDHYDVIGANNLIAGIYENYRESLIESHSHEWGHYWSLSEKCKKNSWQVPCFIIGVGGVVGSVVWFIRWIISLFSDFSEGWAQTQWMWTGIVLGGSSLVIAIVCLALWFVNEKKGDSQLKRCCEHYDSIIGLFKE